MLQDFSELQRSLIGTSPPMLALFDLITKYGASNRTVLIQGESGTGKELVAHALHRLSPRAMRQFIAVNCGEVNENLIQSELFGHERGAFTGADRLKLGWFEVASGGTLFLDEIGEMSPLLQQRLLRALQERQIHRLGSTHLIDIDVRIIAATNVDLEQAVHDGLFRSDLYHRINVLAIITPPLRERHADIPALIEHFRMKLEEEEGSSIAGVSAEAMALLRKYAWPGNVRELQNVMDRAVLLACKNTIEPQHLPAEITNPKPVGEGITGSYDLLKEAQREACAIVLNRVDGNARRAAEIMGHEIKNFHRTLKRLQLTHLVKPSSA